MRTDFYPSRVGREAKLMKREDPVIHNRGKFDGPLNDSDLDVYEENGFLMLNDVFSEDEVDIMAEQLNTLAPHSPSKSTI